MRSIFMVIMLTLLFVNVFSQKSNVSGTVFNSEGNPIKGIIIAVLDTKIKVKTDKKGTFDLKSVFPSDSIVIFINKKEGYKFVL